MSAFINGTFLPPPLFAPDGHLGPLPPGVGRPPWNLLGQLVFNLPVGGQLMPLDGAQPGVLAEVGIGNIETVIIPKPSGDVTWSFLVIVCLAFRGWRRRGWLRGGWLRRDLGFSRRLLFGGSIL